MEKSCLYTLIVSDRRHVVSPFNKLNDHCSRASINEAYTKQGYTKLPPGYGSTAHRLISAFVCLADFASL